MKGTMFNSTTAMAMTAYFLSKQSGAMSKLKLMKLLYLAERGYLLTYGGALTGDRLTSMPQGPVLSSTLSFLNGLDGDLPKDKGGEHAFWREYFRKGVDPNTIVLKAGADVEKLYYHGLSGATKEILAELWGRFGHMTANELRNYTHEDCPEWRDPGGSSAPISYKTIFMESGTPADEAAEIEREINALSAADALLHELLDD